MNKIESKPSDMTKHKNEAMFDHVHRAANNRKRTVYWIGLLEGALSSGRIEDGEEMALFAEAKKFADFFNDPDASDLAEDISAKCFSCERDMMEQLSH